jgi:uncharacterized RDD family membrane protein YckC
MMNTPPPMHYASLWSRSNAYGYDVIIVQLITLVPMFLFYHFPSMEQLLQQSDNAADWFLAFTTIALVVSAAYNILFIASDWQATPGKRHCKIAVVTEDGSALTLQQSALRHFSAGAIGAAMLIFNWLGMVDMETLFTLNSLGLFFALFTKERTALHDMICKTRVIRVKASAK